jgi:DNA repair protein RadB
MSIERISLGCSPLDEMLNGGIEKGCITEIYGEGGSGKTNICIQFSINLAKNGKKLIFIDSEGVSLERINQIFDNKEDGILKNILFYKPMGFKEQGEMIEQTVRLMDKIAVDAIVVDSITNFYRSQDVNINALLGKQMNTLLNIARKNNIPVLITNQVYQDINNGYERPRGGYAIDHRTKIIIKIKKGKFGTRKAILMKHRSIEEGKIAKFKITQDGIK